MLLYFKPPHILLLLFAHSLFFWTLAFGTSSVPREEHEGHHLREIELKYSTSKALQMDVKKVLKLGILKKERTAYGQLRMAKKGKLRLDLESPEKSSLIVNGSAIHFVEYPESTGKLKTRPKVLVFGPSKNLKSQTLLTFMLGETRLMSAFKVRNQKKISETELEYELTPKSEASEVNLIRVNLDPKKSIINKITLVDPVENETVFHFSNVEFNKPVNLSLFNYKVPKDADVTHME